MSASALVLTSKFLHCSFVMSLMVVKGLFGLIPTYCPTKFLVTSIVANAYLVCYQIFATKFKFNTT